MVPLMTVPVSIISLLAECTVMATPASAYERTIGHERNSAKWTAKVPDRLVAADGLIAGDSEETTKKRKRTPKTTATRSDHRLASGE